MNVNLPIQEMAFDPGSDVVETAIEPVVLLEEEDERPVTVETPSVWTCPEEIKKISDVIGNQADLVEKGAALRDRIAVQRVLQARWAGETNMQRLAALLGVKRQSLYRILSRGENREHIAYETFYAAFHQMHSATVFTSLATLQRASQSGSPKYADVHLKYTAGDLIAKEKADVSIEGDVNMQINGLNLSGKTNNEILRIMGEAFQRIPEAQRKSVFSRLPAEAQKYFEGENRDRDA